MNIEKEFLIHIHQQFNYYKMLGDKTFAQLSEADFFWQPDEDANSIAIIVNHLWGNMKSRWTNFLTSDGEKPWRNRDKEFENEIRSEEDLIRKWEDGWQCLFTALSEIPDHFSEIKIYIRNQEHSIIAALHRQLAHYAYHVGQIVYLGRWCKGQEWESLSIPKGQSKVFNQEKFSRGKHGGHFSEDII